MKIEKVLEKKELMFKTTIDEGQGFEIERSCLIKKYDDDDSNWYFDLEDPLNVWIGGADMLDEDDITFLYKCVQKAKRIEK